MICNTTIDNNMTDATIVLALLSSKLWHFSTRKSEITDTTIKTINLKGNHFNTFHLIYRVK